MLQLELLHICKVVLHLSDAAQPVWAYTGLAACRFHLLLFQSPFTTGNNPVPLIA